MSFDQTSTVSVRVNANGTIAKRLGDWTDRGVLAVRAHRGRAVVDLRSARLPEEMEILLEVDHGVVALLVDDTVRIDTASLTWSGRGRLKDRQATGDEVGRMVHLAGGVRHGEVRVYRGGMAVFMSIFDWGHLQRMRAEHERHNTAGR